MNERARFVSMYQQQASLSLTILSAIPAELWTSIPADSETNFLGERIRKITIAGLCGHLLQAEYYWVTALAKVRTGDSLPPPVGVPMVQPEPAGEALIAQYRQQLQRISDAINALPDAQLQVEFRFIGRLYTVQGFLWAMYAHHAYHFGQIDLLLRQQGYLPPEFLELPELHALIG
ncbi:MAG TPA: DinB family protein [Rheinheimera sp.]|nr:DinB family protein [Rheinheimera sp.]